MLKRRILLHLLVVLSAAHCSCSGSSSAPSAAAAGPLCNGFAGFGLMDGSAACNFSLESCSDGRTYAVTCSGAPAACACQIDGDASVATGGAGLDVSVCGLSGRSLIDTLNRGCGWNLE